MPLLKPAEAEAVYKRIKMERYGWLRGRGNKLFTSVASAVHEGSVAPGHLTRLGAYLKLIDKFPEPQRQQARHSFVAILKEATDRIDVDGPDGAVQHLLRRTASLFGSTGVESEWFRAGETNSQAAEYAAARAANPNPAKRGKFAVSREKLQAFLRRARDKLGARRSTEIGRGKKQGGK